MNKEDLSDLGTAILIGGLPMMAVFSESYWLRVVGLIWGLMGWWAACFKSTEAEKLRKLNLNGDGKE